MHYLAARVVRNVIARYLVAEENEEVQPSSGNKRMPAQWKEWLDAVHVGGKKKVPNPNSATRSAHPQVSFSTALKDKQFYQKALEDYHKWVARQKDDDKGKSEKKPEKEEKPAKKALKDLALPEDRYKNTQYSGYSDKMLEAFPKLKSKGDLVDLVGGAVVSSSEVEFFVGKSLPPLEIEIRSSETLMHIRKIDIDKDGEMYVYNDTLFVRNDSPKGLGTKIFASQVASAKKLGAKYLKCEAYRDFDRPSWVGYKVWPKMGYDGPVPDQVSADIPEDLVEEMTKQGSKKPWKVSDLYMSQKGQDWWEENGESFDAKFDLSDDSHSMKVLEAYLEKTAERKGVDVKELLKVASIEAIVSRYINAAKKDKSEKGRDEKGHEEIPLSKEEDNDLRHVWDKLRKSPKAK
jgi:hypothetical protein